MIAGFVLTAILVAILAASNSTEISIGALVVYVLAVGLLCMMQ